MFCDEFTMCWGFRVKKVDLVLRCCEDVNTEFSTKVLLEVVDTLKEEGYTKPEILAHLNLIDLEYRT